MTPICHSSSPFPPEKGNGDLNDLLSFASHVSQTTPSTAERKKRDNDRDEAENHNPAEGASTLSQSGYVQDNLVSEFNLPNFGELKPLIHRQPLGSDDDQNSKWMSSKVRMMKKMANRPNPDQLQASASLSDDDNSSNSPSSSKIRICSDCNTTKTPLWRSGPQGPKTLCNACGIRQRKARRALAAAATTGSSVSADSTSVTSSSRKVIKQKRSVSEYKKRCKLGGPRSAKKIRFEDFTLSLSNSSALQQVFPQDEKEAAILLMALSCGLVQG